MADLTALVPQPVAVSAAVTVEETEITESDILDEAVIFTSTNAICVTHESYDSSSSSESLIEFPVELNVAITPFSGDFNDASGIFDANGNKGDEAVYHMGLSKSQVPVYATDSKAFDVRSALKNAITCPVKYISRVPPTMVTENYCFVIDGDVVSIDAINADSEQWWKGTGTAIRYYYSDELKKFYQVNALLSRGEVRCAYRAKDRGGGMEQVPLDQIFKVLRRFSYWNSCSGFHRIISVVSPVTKIGEMRSGFRRRIFVQYLWRTNKPSDRQRVAQEYERRRKISKVARTSLDAGRRPESLALSSQNLRRSRFSLDTGSDIAAFIRRTAHGKLT